MFWHDNSKMPKINYGMTLRALFGGINECGDIGFIKEDDNQCFLALVDVLGHGSEARKIALTAEDYFKNNYNKDLVEIIKGLHVQLTGTRGAVAAICRLDIVTGELSYVGIGNITVRILGSRAVRLVSKDGVVGYRNIKPQINSLKLRHGDSLLLHSDGIREHFDGYECASFIGDEAEIIASKIIAKFRKENDDASCIVLKYLR